MSEKTQEGGVSPVSEKSIDEQITTLKGHAHHVEQTLRIHRNMGQLISQSTYRGDSAVAVAECLKFIDEMIGNLNGQLEHINSLIGSLTPPIKKEKKKAVRLVSKGRKK